MTADTMVSPIASLVTFSSVGNGALSKARHWSNTDQYDTTNAK